MATELEMLAWGRFYDPHKILGIRNGVLRAWRPGASDVVVLWKDGSRSVLKPVGKEGVFEAAVEGKNATAKDYEIQAIYGDSKSHQSHDPYAFAPTLGNTDLHLFAEGTHRRLWEKMGARVMEVDGISGTAFAVWAPNAGGVSVVGDFNFWDGRQLPMRSLGASGVWELFVPGIGDGALYKFEIHNDQGTPFTKADPFARATELPPATASRVVKEDYKFTDEAWMKNRASVIPQQRPLNVYEMHLGSWKTKPEEGDRSYTYREMAEPLADYLVEMGFTHVELMPVMEHPYGPSWGYQVSNYFAPTARFGRPDDLRYLIDHLHAHGIGVILDWVPAHFPKDEWAMGRYDGTALFEHSDPRQGEHPDWGTYIFNYGRSEVRAFLLSNALFWLDSFHADGIRIDAVASMLYLDYSRSEGEWIANEHGGRENIAAISFLRDLNKVCHAEHPGVLMIAEESTAWGGVSRPLESGGLGFGFKWNMGWMHDTLDYFARDPIHRKYHHHELTFSLIYAWTENFILPLSHDEVVHGKGSLLDRMPGDPWQKFANLRALYGWMWAHPGKKMLFMGQEFGQGEEWKHDRSLDWHQVEIDWHAGLLKLVADLNRHVRDLKPLHELDCEPAGFRWIDGSNEADNLLLFRRLDRSGQEVVVAANLSPVLRENYLVGLPAAGAWAEILNTDAEVYGGGGKGNGGGVEAVEKPWHGLAYSAQMTIPPLAVVWLKKR